MQTGTAGDMILGGLFDLGLDFPAWKSQMDSLGLTGIELGIAKVSKQGIMATRFRADAPHEHAHRGLAEISAIISGSGVPERAKENALIIFARLARVEARIHGLSVEEVHFHEVGALDAIVDIVGACVGFEMLGIREFWTTPFTFGTGTVQTAHGILGVPVPATLALSEGFPARRTNLPGELCTPTGTAIISALAKPLPSDWIGSVKRVGYGAGGRDLPGIANVLRLCLMEGDPFRLTLERQERRDASANDVYQVECNLDNMTPELIGYTAERLLAAGCNDVWQEPIFMKKNRAAVKLCALVGREGLDSALSLIASETATGGMRYFPVSRLVAEKSMDTVETRFGTVELKRVVFHGLAGPRFAPEFESCRKLAEAAVVPLQEIYREALLQAALKGFAGKEAQ
ncbi:MAG: nickel pincer cofactor biosynthesis protein LarC [Fibrobacterota bacterium]|nr:nickel pincer cofactor biosynthesis protein LarC [Fibrobacterota bacterium]